MIVIPNLKLAPGADEAALKALAAARKSGLRAFGDGMSRSKREALSLSAGW